ncbi:MAG: hypothetical protein WCJ30_01215 [Deltaproteobacteria bacterium]
MKIAIAPGKVMLAGEYAVLEGGDAIVMAVDRYVEARKGAGAPLPPESAATLALAQREGPLGGDHPMHLDTRALEEGGQKLGLGSSAAGCAAALVLAAYIEGVAIQARRKTLATLARRGHREAQGGGSGVDVLASVYGGVVKVSFPRGPGGEPVVEPIEWPSTLAWRVLWTGVPARTSDLIRDVRSFQDREPDAMKTILDELRGATAGFELSLRTRDAPGAVRAVREHFRAMDHLGRASQSPIVTDSMRQLAAEVEPLGAGIKPSGAGGGDIVLAVAHDEEVMDNVVRRATTLGFVPLTLQIDRGGARIVEGGKG